MSKLIFSVHFILIVILFISCSPEEINKENKKGIDYKKLAEYDLLFLPIKGELNESYAEISGLCWYGSKLLVLPQYPSRFGQNEGRIFYIEKKEIKNFIEAESKEQINYSYFSIDLKGMEKYFNLGSGFEAVTVNENNIFLTIEFMEDGKTESVLIKGEIDSLKNKIYLDKLAATKVARDINLHNISDESILYYNNRIIPIYEVYGQNINRRPKVPVYTTELSFLKELDFPNIEYRITDVTSVDDSGRFWAINYFYPGDNKKLNPATDLFFSEYGIGSSHLEYDQVERIVQYQIIDDKIILSPLEPIYIKLTENESRNWEGIAKFGNKGFLIATDTYPRTILAYLNIKNHN